MLYSFHHKFVFVHVWKTAGESIVEALRPSCNPAFSSKSVQRFLRRSPANVATALGWRAILIRNQHLKAHEIKEIMPDGLFDDCYSFGFVRNPWDRLISGYHYAQQTPRHPEHAIVRDLTNVSDFITYRENNSPVMQSDLLFDEKDRQLVTKIGRFETLRQDFDSICVDLNITASLKKTNSSTREADWRTYFTDKDFKRVGQIYRRDIELFGYDQTTLD